MKLLLDTHAFLWLSVGDPAVSATARAAVEDESAEIWLSVASVWEIAIKQSLGKLELSADLDVLLDEAVSEQGVRILDVRRRHATRVATLPFHHRDPFDRLLVAQSLVEGYAVVTIDDQFDAYGVIRVW